MRTNHAHTVVPEPTSNEDPKTTTPPDPADGRRVLPDAGPLPEGPASTPYYSVQQTTMSPYGAEEPRVLRVEQVGQVV